MGAAQSVASAQPVANQAEAAIEHQQSPALQALQQKFPSLAAFDFAGQGVTEADYGERLKDIVEMVDMTMSQMPQNEMVGLMQQTHGAMSNVPVCRFFWADASSILGKAPENFRKKTVQVAETYGCGAAAKNCLKGKLPATLKSVKQGGYMGHALVLNVLGFRGPDSDQPDPLGAYAHASMQSIPAQAVTQGLVPTRAPEQTFAPGYMPVTAPTRVQCCCTAVDVHFVEPAQQQSVLDSQCGSLGTGTKDSPSA